MTSLDLAAMAMHSLYHSQSDARRRGITRSTQGALKKQRRARNKVTRAMKQRVRRGLR
jgi:hypothetical protein